MPLLEGYLTRPELARELGVHTKTVERYESQPNGLPSVTIGGRKYYRRTAVLAWIESRERKPNQRRRVA
ncbi:hypothetical protein A33M_2919 [Rhodovulum sp. PH10]|uniref:helix-turn-helix transcriptional regulator n=1 Tax=Rhodovulum sp. PH10 TaxID=1187851 RepID=UPI00027C2B4F|nr:helix-turn-helix domain-containing protein [Rhodovulum sp. PH10]EJW11722.1 hypothetical protein A33M_2919 [Rhodovulum sp. PH10]